MSLMSTMNRLEEIVFDNRVYLLLYKDHWTAFSIHAVSQSSANHCLVPLWKNMNIHKCTVINQWMVLLPFRKHLVELLSLYYMNNHAFGSMREDWSATLDILLMLTFSGWAMCYKELSCSSMGVDEAADSSVVERRNGLLLFSFIFVIISNVWIACLNVAPQSALDKLTSVMCL